MNPIALRTFYGQSNNQPTKFGDGLYKPFTVILGIVYGIGFATLYVYIYIIAIMYQ